MTEKAIILKKKPLFESAFQIMAFSQKSGRFYAIARNQSSKKNPFHGNLEVPNYTTLSLRHKHSASYVNQSDPILFFSNIRNDFNKITLASYLINILIHVTSLNQPEPWLFECLLNSLNQINQLDQQLDVIQLKFEQAILNHEGLHPNSSTLTSPQCIKLIESYANKAIIPPNYLI